MQHFLRLTETVPQTPSVILNGLQFRPWWRNNIIWLRKSDEGPLEPWAQLPQVREPILDLMRMVGATGLGDVLIEKVAPASRAKFNGMGMIRYEMILQALPGVSMKIGEEQIAFKPGDVWVWKAETLAERVNESADDSISLLMEIQTQ